MATTAELSAWIGANLHLKGTPQYQQKMAEYRAQAALEQQAYDEYQARQAQAQQGVASLAQQPQSQADNPISGFWDAVGSGVTSTKAAYAVSPEVLFGNKPNRSTAASITEALQEGERPVTPELLEAQRAFADEAKMMAEAKHWYSPQKLAGMALMVGEGVRQLATNPKGMSQMAGQQLANTVGPMIGATLGAKAFGAAAAPVAGASLAIPVVGEVAAPIIEGGAVGAGAIVGAFSAQAPVETGSEFIGLVGDELQKRKLPLTQENVQAVLQDRDFVNDAVNKSFRKGMVTASVDAVTTIFGGKLARGPAEAAVRQATRELGAAADVASITQRASEIVKARSIGQKVATGAKALGVDVVGGGASEAAGQLAAYGEVNSEDVAQEMLGEITGGIIEIPSAANALRKKITAGGSTPTTPSGNNPPAVIPPGGTPPAVIPPGGTPTGGTPTGATPPGATPPGGTPPAGAAQETPEEKKIREKKERLDRAMEVINQHAESTGRKEESQENEWSLALQQGLGISAKEASNLLKDMTSSKLVSRKSGDNNTRKILDEAEEQRRQEERRRKQEETSQAILSQATGQVPAPTPAEIAAATTEDSTATVQPTEPTKPKAAEPVAPVAKPENKPAPEEKPVPADMQEVYDRAVAHIDNLRSDIDTALGAKVTTDSLVSELGIDKETASKLRRLLVDKNHIMPFGGLAPKKKTPATATPVTQAADPRNPNNLPTSPPKEGGAWFDPKTGHTEYAFPQEDSDTTDEGETIPFEEKKPASQPGEEVEQRQEAPEKTETAQVGGVGTQSVEGGTGAGVPVPVSRQGAPSSSTKGTESASVGNAQSGSQGANEGAGPSGGTVDTNVVAEPTPKRTQEQRVADLETAVNEGRLVGKAERDKINEIKEDIKNLPAPDSPNHRDAVISINKKLGRLESKAAESTAPETKSAFNRARDAVTRMKDRLLDRKKRTVDEERREMQLENENIDLVHNYVRQHGVFDSAAIKEEYGINPAESTEILERLRGTARVINFDRKNADISENGVIRKVEVKPGTNKSVNSLYFRSAEDYLNELEQQIENLDHNEIVAIFGPKLEKGHALAAKQKRILTTLEQLESAIESLAKSGDTKAARSMVRNMERAIRNEEELAQEQRERDKLTRATKVEAARVEGSPPQTISQKLYDLAKAGNLRDLLTYMMDNAGAVGVDMNAVARWVMASESTPETQKEKIEKQQAIIDDDKSSEAKKENARKELARILSGKSYREEKLEKQIAALNKSIDDATDPAEKDRLSAKLAQAKQKLSRMVENRTQQFISRAVLQAPNISSESRFVSNRDSLIKSILNGLRSIDLSTVTVVVEDKNSPSDAFRALRKMGHAAAYVPNTNTIYLTTDVFSSPMLIAHEIAHAVTAKAISEYQRISSETSGRSPVEVAQERVDEAEKNLGNVSKKNNYDPDSEAEIPAEVEAAQHALDDANALLDRMRAVERINEIFKEAKARLSGRENTSHYFENVAEFIAYAYTDARLQYMLSTVKMPKNKSKLSQIVGKTQDMLSELAQNILELLGVTNFRRKDSAKIAEADARHNDAIRNNKRERAELSKIKNAIKALDEEANRAYTRTVNAAIQQLAKARKEASELRKDLAAFDEDLGIGRLSAPKINDEDAAFKKILTDKVIEADRKVIELQNKMAKLTDISGEEKAAIINQFRQDSERDLLVKLGAQQQRVDDSYKALEKARAAYEAMKKGPTSTDEEVAPPVEWDEEEFTGEEALVDLIEAIEQIMSTPGSTNNLSVMYAKGQKNKSGKPQQKKKGTYKGLTSVLEIRAHHAKNMAKKLFKETHSFLPTGEYYLGSLSGIRNLIRDYANSRRIFDDMQNDIKRLGKLVISGAKANNIYDLISTSAGKTKFAMTTTFGRAQAIVDANMGKLNSILASKFNTIQDPETGKPRDWKMVDTISWLDLYMKALHIKERRFVKYILNVPMSLTKNIPIKMPDGSVKMMSAAGYRDTLYRALQRDTDMTSGSGNGQALLIRDMIEDLVNGGGKYVPAVGVNPKTGKSAYLDPEGAATNDRDYPAGKAPKARSLDMNDDRYNVYGELSDTQVNDLLNDYDDTINNTDKIKEPLGEVIEALREIQDRTRELNKQAGYESTPASNVMAFNNFQHYVPLKGTGATNVEVSPGDDRFELNSPRMASDMTDAPAMAYGGRKSESDDVISRIQDEAFKSASRVGRDGVVAALGNLSEMFGKRFGGVAATFSFEERHSGAARKKLRELQGKKNVFFHFKKDGSVVAYELFDRKIVEAVRRTYSPKTDIETKFSKLTQFVSQQHTRFKLSFAPYDYIRNVKMNTNEFRVEWGLRKGIQLAWVSAARFGRGTLHKAAFVLHAYNSGNTEKLNKLLQESPIYHDMIEFLQKGGESAYLQIFTKANKLGTLIEELQRGKLVRAKDVMVKYFDLWNNMYDLSNRSAAYSVARDQFNTDFTKDFKKKNSRDPDEAEAENILEQAREHAAAFTKNIANFEQSGARSELFTSKYSFFKAAATGAVKGFDQIMPLFVNSERMYKNMYPDLKALADKDPEAKKNYEESWDKRRSNARKTAFLRFTKGAMWYLIARSLAGDDDEGRNKTAIDDKAQWTRNARLPLDWLTGLLGDSGVANKIKSRFSGQYLQIPWGFGFGAFDAVGAQFAALLEGDIEPKDFLFNTSLIALDSFMPLPVSRINPWEHEEGAKMGATMLILDTWAGSVIRPAFELLANVNGLGREIFTENVNKYGPTYQNADKNSDFINWATQKYNDAFDAELQPSVATFLLSSYLDGPTEIANWAFELHKLSTTDKAMDPRTVSLVANRFLGAPSRVDSKEYFKVRHEAEHYIRKLNELKNQPDGRYYEYIEKHPRATFFRDIYNSTVNGSLKDVQGQISAIRANKLLTEREKQLRLKDLYDSRDQQMYYLVKQYKAISDDLPD